MTVLDQPIRTTNAIKLKPWIQTVSGIKFHFLSGSPDEVSIEDIATALSRSPRWAGHTTDFFSVAQHCVYTAEYVKELGGDKKEQLIGLLHDATEAYMCDIPAPLKRLLPRFKEIERKVWGKIGRKFFGKTTEITELVHFCDTCLLATEARDLFAFPPLDDWVRRCPNPWDSKIVPVGPKAAHNLYLKTWEEIGYVIP